jgi:L-cysteine desulfidase
LAGGGEGRAVIEGTHTRLTGLWWNDTPLPTGVEEAGPESAAVREALCGLGFDHLIAFARTLSDDDRQHLRRGVELNVAISHHGLALFPARFSVRTGGDSVSRASRMVCAGVYARMWGEDFLVMSLAGSGNKGIVCAVPLELWGAEMRASAELIDEALALACLITSVTTHHLGTLSAVCGCSNAAGIGLAAGLVLLEGGGSREMSLAINNMVGNVTGMVCDGAKIGCALKTMTAVDAAFRAASLAMTGIGIPVSDGIVGSDGMASLANLGRIATSGMTSVDSEILDIMREKLCRSSRTEAGRH